METWNELLKLNSQTDYAGLVKPTLGETKEIEYSDQQSEADDPVAEMSKEYEEEEEEEIDNRKKYIETIPKEDSRGVGYFLKELEKQETPKKLSPKMKESEKSMVPEEKAFMKEIEDLANKAREGNFFLSYLSKLLTEIFN